MKRAIAIAALALGLAPVWAQAHGPGGGTLWQNMPTKDIVHTHCTNSARAQEFFVTVSGQSVGVGKHTENPTSTDWYLIVPSPVPSQGDTVHNKPEPLNTNPCFDSSLP
jgi:hypothetical protein